MILAALFLVAQDSPPPPSAGEVEAAQVEEVVIQAKLGRTTMLFDKGADGRLHNCRIMVSSGSQRRDEAACQATPVCYARTADEVTDCRELTVIEQAALLANRPAAPEPAPGRGVETFTMPTLVKPVEPPAPNQFGPAAIAGESKEAERQSVKLPPRPRSPTDAPAIRFTVGDGTDETQDTRP